MTRVTAIHPLSPAQQGMVLETLGATEAGMHVEQARFAIRSAVDRVRFAEAWRTVVRRHSILRTSFSWHGHRQPLAVVLDAVEVPLTLHDWRSEADPDAHLRAFLDADVAAGFALDRAPLLRLALAQTHDTHTWLVVTFHHAILDGWSLAQVLAEALAAYGGADLGPPAPPFGTYVRWLARRDRSEADAYWRGALAGYTPPERWGATPTRARGAPGFGEHHLALPAAVSDALRSAARRERVSLATVVLGVWAALFARYADRRDVSIGVTESDRPPAVPGVLGIAGVFIHTVPVRIEVPAAAPLWPWLRELHRSAAARVGIGAPPAGSGPPVETVLVVENYPEDTSGLDRSELRVDLVESRTVGAKTRAPLTWMIGVRGGLTLHLVHHLDRIDPTAAAAFADQFAAALGVVAVAHDPTTELSTAAAPEVHPAREVARPRYVAPRDVDEVAVAAVFRESLGRELGVHDDFFALGGHSLLALQLIGRLEQRLGVALPLAALIGSPTIEGVAHAVRAARTPGGWTPVVPITDGTGRPLVCVPGAAMDVVSLVPLARALGGPVLGLQPIGLDGRREPLDRVEQIAGEYVEALRRAVPEGPYTLAGHSFGALVAWEMVRQLREAGAQVELLVVLDAAARGGAAATAAAARTRPERLQRMVSMARRFFGRDLPDVPTGPEVDPVRAVATSLTEAGVLPEGLGLERLERYLRVGEATGAAFEAYRPAPSAQPVRTVVVRALDHHADDDVLADDDGALGWTAVAGDAVSVAWVPGDHVTLLAQPAVERVAAAITAARVPR